MALTFSVKGIKAINTVKQGPRLYFLQASRPPTNAYGGGWIMRASMPSSPPNTIRTNSSRPVGRATHITRCHPPPHTRTHRRQNVPPTTTTTNKLPLLCSSSCARRFACCEYIFAAARSPHPQPQGSTPVHSQSSSHIPPAPSFLPHPLHPGERARAPSPHTDCHHTAIPPPTMASTPPPPTHPLTTSTARGRHSSPAPEQ